MPQGARDGHLENYDVFYVRMRDHYSNTNPSYIRILDKVEQTNETITMERLRTVQMENLELDWDWLSQHLWTTMAYFVNDTVLSRRKVYTQGEEWNGIELWRAMFVEGKGGSVTVTVTGQTGFHNFPKCQKTEQLQLHVGE